MAGIKGQPGTKPAQVKDPVPGQAEINSFEAYQAQAAAPKSFEEFNASTSGAQAPGPSAEVPAEIAPAPSGAQQAADIGLRALDYPGGIARTGLAGIAGTVTGQPNIVTTKDVAAAATGKAPSSAEYLRRLGVSEGGSLDVPWLGRVTVRGAEGLALDIATDPLTLVARTVRELPYLKNILNGPGQAANAVGEAVYKSALPKKVREAADVIIEGVPAAGIPGAPIGGTAKLAEKINAMSNAMGGLRQGLYDKAAGLGAVVNMTDVPLKKTEAVLTKMGRDPNLAPLAQELNTFVQNYRNIGPASLDLVSEWKTNLYNALPDSAWQGGIKLKGVAKQFKAALALDFRDAIVRSGNAAEKGLGTTIDKLNDKWGQLLSVTKPMQQAVGAGGSGSLGRMIDGAVLATGGIKGQAVKKGYDIATSPYMKTVVGNALMTAGKHGLATGAVNRAMINLANQGTNPAEPQMSAPPAAPDQFFDTTPPDQQDMQQ